MMRFFVTAGWLASVGADEFTWDCSRRGPVCGTVCCAAGWQREGVDGAYTCKSASAECQLCGGGGGDLPACNFGAGLHAALLDENDQPVPIKGTNIIGGAGVSVLAPTFPNAGVRLQMGTFDGMRGWSDIPKSVFSDFHETLRGLTATVPSFYTGAEFSIEYDCFLGGNAKGCDIFFFVYRCPPCTARNGNIGKELLEMDAPAWYADSCGPTFLLNSEAAGLATHQFAMYAAELPNGEAIKIKLNHPVEFMFWAMAGKRALCDQASSEADCELHANCQWLASQNACRPRSCAKKMYFQGPVVPKCGVCVDDEAEFVPEVIIR